MNDITAIDIHVHVHDEVSTGVRADNLEAMSKYFGTDMMPRSLDELADQYRARRMKAVLLGTADETSSGRPPLPNSHIGAAVRKHPDVFHGFGAVDPWQGRIAIDEIKRCREEYGLQGLGEFNPARQGFFPNDPRFTKLWETAQSLNMAVMFHGGMAGAGAGTPGGGGIKLKFAQPIHIDDVAADFPELTIICAHPSWPWQSESLAIARHKQNVYIDISGWSPKYFPAELVQQMNSVLQDKVLFGSDWPVMSVERWMKDFDELDLKPEVRQKVLLTNAAKLLEHTASSSR